MAVVCYTSDMTAALVWNGSVRGECLRALGNKYAGFSRMRERQVATGGRFLTERSEQFSIYALFGHRIGLPILRLI
jgi:hypothetical protein